MAYIGSVGSNDMSIQIHTLYNHTLNRWISLRNSHYLGWRKQIRALIIHKLWQECSEFMDFPYEQELSEMMGPIYRLNSHPDYAWRYVPNMQQSQRKRSTRRLMFFFSQYELSDDDEVNNKPTITLIFTSGTRSNILFCHQCAPYFKELKYSPRFSTSSLSWSM